MIHLREGFLEQLKGRYEEAYSMNQRFVRILYEAATLCAPLSEGLNVLYGFNDTGKNENRRIYNSTPKWCSNSRANKLHSLLLPINKKWGSVYKTENRGVSAYQEAVTDTIFDYIDKSNLHSVAKSFFLDLNIGCAALWVDTPQKGKVQFRNIAGLTLMPEYSDEPGHCNVWFKRTVNWYELNRVAPEKAAKNNDKGKEYHLTCGYIDVRDEKGLDGDCLYIQFFETDFGEPIALELHAFNRLILVNETLRPGEARGHGVILQILEDIELLNNLTGSLNKYIEYTAEPALTVPDQLISPISDLKGALLPSELAEDGKPIVQPVQWQLPVEWVYTWIKYYEEKIQRFFNVMPLGLPEETPKATATEANYRQADEERQTVADMSRVANETLGGIMRRVFDVARHWGDIEVSERDIFDFKFDSPEVDVQSQENINAILQLSELNAQINGPGSGPLYMNPKRTYQYLADNLKTPQTVNNTAQEIQTITENLQQQAQEHAPSGTPEEELQRNTMSPSPLQPAQAVNPTQLGQQTRIGGVGI